MTSFKKTTYLFLSLFFMSCCFSLYAEAQRVKGKRARRNNAELRTDSLQSDSLLLDSLATDSLMADSLASDSTDKQPLDAPVIYEASDSIVFTKGGYAHLYGNGKVNYQNIELTSAKISMNMEMEKHHTSRKPCAIISRPRKVSLTILLPNKGKDM